jgi:hypothetical protein
MSDEEPKSAYELAMERLRKQDAEQGVTEQPLSDAQKEAIAEAQRTCKAKLAELEIMHRSKLAGVSEADALETLERNYRREVDRAREERDRAIARIRSGGATKHTSEC